MATRIVFGCGYLGRRVALRWRAAGDRVVAVTRSDPTARQFVEQGLEPLVADVTKPETLRGLPQAETLLYAVGYDRSGGPSIQEVYATGLANVLAAAAPSTERVVYISTTGVYGDADGEWIDETTPPAPSRDGGRASLAAEEILGTSPFASRGVSLRLAGIYGPDRLPYLAQLQAGEPIAAPSTGWLNLIHVDDAATTVLAAADQAAPPPIVCVSDGQPPLRSDYYAEVARLIGAAPPTFTDPTADSPRAARAAASKRVRSDLLARGLGVSLRYPSYREGLAAILGPA
ncbi:NAD-dependent epimerase/dehydratase family protein [Botrimarina mediterranea]|uniref:NAD-dependent epimerase/dehydratase family protein n=1 Tax=Botrimarina mediterranea TaxID=2528022 RepID=UPI00118D0686|nr:NAD dependent epimerase/dehydratase family protein [Planctomycetes bacterium K2D]